MILQDELQALKKSLQNCPKRKKSQERSLLLLMGVWVWGCRDGVPSHLFGSFPVHFLVGFHCSCHKFDMRYTKIHLALGLPCGAEHIPRHGLEQLKRNFPDVLHRNLERNKPGPLDLDSPFGMPSLPLPWLWGSPESVLLPSASFMAGLSLVTGAEASR